jgi:predicted Zn-dependent protease
VAAPGSTGYAESYSHEIGRIDVEGTGRRAAEKAALSAEPGEVPPGEYTAILEPVAVAELLYFLVYGSSFSHFAGLAVLEGQSFFANRLGQKVFGENVTLRDDVLHETQWGVPFDAEGVPRRRLTLIERGVLKDLTYDRATARRAGVEPTGHGLPLPNVLGSAPQNLVLEGGTTSVEDLVRSTQRGILVTRLWYIRIVDPADLIVTGLTRDGTFLIEDGRIVKGLRNYRCNQSLRAMLNQVTGLSPVVRASPIMSAPALRVEGFTFSALVPKEAG